MNRGFAGGPGPSQGHDPFKLAVAGFGVLALINVWDRFQLWIQPYGPQIKIVAWFGGSAALLGSATWLWNYYVTHVDYEKSLTSFDEAAVKLGSDTRNKPHYLKERFRTMHAQVIGTTSAGKTESVILPWIIRDIERGNGILIIDGKSDRSFLDKLYGYVALNKRQDDFKLFSLVDVPRSAPFNPLIGGATEEIAERVFASFTIENEYYRGMQYRFFQATLHLLTVADLPRNIANVIYTLTESDFLEELLSRHSNDRDLKPLMQFVRLSNDKRWELISGLLTSLGHFNSSSHSLLFNSSSSGIDFTDALTQNHIIYFQLPTMLYPFLGEATGKLALQCFQSAIARRHTSEGSTDPKRFFSCFLDDFQDYIYPGFGSLLNKSRSANVGVVFAHQALGDLDKVSPAFRNIVTTNTNIKVVMRTMDPDTCEYFAKSFGTKTSEKKTRRSTQGFLSKTETGDESIRDVEEYRFHPNVIKSLALGEGIITIPHPKGVKIAKLDFAMRPSVDIVELPLIEKLPHGYPKLSKPITKAKPHKIESK